MWVDSSVATAANQPSGDVLDAVLRGLPGAIIAFGEDGRVLLASQEAEDLLGFVPGTLVGQTISRLFPVDLRTSPEQFIELAARRADGSTCPVDLVVRQLQLPPLPGAPPSNPPGFRVLYVAWLRDVVGRADTELAVFRAEERFRVVIERTPDGVYIHDQHAVIQVNPALMRMLGHERADEVVGRDAHALVYPEDRAEIRALTRQVHDDSEATPARIFRYVRKDGSLLHASVSALALTINGVRCIMVTLRDVTEQLRAEEAVRRWEASFRTVIEALPDAIMVCHAGRIRYANPQLLRLLKYPSLDDLLDRTFASVVHIEDGPMVERHWKTSEEPGHRGLEHRLTRHDGESVWVESVAIEVVFDGQPSLLLVARDVTERKRLQAQLLLADRMASVGTLAAGVAHEINNPLSYVTTNIEWVERELTEVAEQGKLGAAVVKRLLDAVSILDEALQGADRVRRIVKDLRTFSRAEDEEDEAIDVHRVLDSAISMARVETRHRARLRQTYGKLERVDANPARLGQVFLNLIVNAAQAIPEGHAERHEIHVETRMVGDQVSVSVSDDGQGIAPTVLSKIFDPFFTTKPIGVGTGLGLSICHTIVAGLGGTIEVDSSVGRGSTFRVLLPSSRSSLRSSSPRRQSSSVRRLVAAPDKTARVLVIDDEPLIGTALVRALGREHEVVAVTSARAALERLRRGERFDGIVCDLMMPDLSGMDFYVVLEREFRHLANRTLFLTGGACTAQARAFIDARPGRCAAKPFEIQELRALVAQIVGNVS